MKKLLLLILFLFLLYFQNKYDFIFQSPIVVKKREEKINKKKVKKIIKKTLKNEQNPTKFSGIKLYHDRDLAGYEAIYVYFGNDKTAYAVAMAESGVNCKKIGYLVCDKAGKCFKSNEPQDYGLFQINKVHLWRFKKFGGDPLNCWDNAKVAKEIYEEQGWHPWSAFKNKSFLSYL